MNRKILIGISIFIAIILIGAGVYFFYTSKKTTTPGGTNNSPFGTPDSNGVIGETQNTVQQTIVGDVNTTITEKQNGLRQISSIPVSDASFVSTTSTTTSIVRFIERSTGNIFEADLTSGVVKRVTNTTVPKIAEVRWGVSGKTFLGQYIDGTSVASSIFEIGTTTASTTPGTESFPPLNSFPLVSNILSSSFNPKGDGLFYLIEGSSGVEGFVSGKRGEKPANIWQFPTTEWIAGWPEANTITLTTKASNGIAGIMYTLNPKTQSTKLVLSGVKGLTTNTSPQGDRVLYTEMVGTTWDSTILDLKFKARLPFPFGVLPEKCVWSKSGTDIYCARARAVSAQAPDDWYQGKVSYDDTLWKYSLTTNEPVQVSELAPGNDVALDVINPRLSPNEKDLVFMNKKDLSLWTVPVK